MATTNNGSSHGSEPRQIVLPPDFPLSDQDIIALLELCARAKEHPVGGEVIVAWEGVGYRGV